MLDDSDLEWIEVRCGCWRQKRRTYFSKGTFSDAPEEEEVEEVDFTVKVDGL